MLFINQEVRKKLGTVLERFWFVYSIAGYIVIKLVIKRMEKKQKNKTRGKSET